jgi:hypothetical protein
VAKGVPVRSAVDVAITLLPTGKAVARHRLHLHVASQQVVAQVDAMLDDLVHKERASDAFAQQSPIHVGESGDDRLDFFPSNKLLQGLQVQLATDSQLLAHGLDPSATNL